MSSLAGVVDVSKVPNCVSFGEPRPGTISPESESVMVMSDFVSDIDLGPGAGGGGGGWPLLPSGVGLCVSSLAGIDDVSQVPNCVSFGELRSGTIAPESGSVMAVSDFVGDSGSGPAGVGSGIRQAEFC